MGRRCGPPDVDCVMVRILALKLNSGMILRTLKRRCSTSAVIQPQHPPASGRMYVTPGGRLGRVARKQMMCALPFRRHVYYSPSADKVIHQSTGGHLRRMKLQILKQVLELRACCTGTRTIIQGLTPSDFRHNMRFRDASDGLTRMSKALPMR